MNTHEIQKDLRKRVEEHMVELPQGSIELRDDRTKQKWIVNIAAFSIAKFAVTQDLYYELTKQRPSSIAGDQLPVETVTWNQAASFCNLLSAALGYGHCYIFDDQNQTVHLDNAATGFRLPTEAEWEYACKAGTTGIRYTDIEVCAWYKNNSKGSTHPVGLKEANPWGLYDMLGNVWEWCTDLYDTQVYGTYRIFRGGGWCDQQRSVMATTRRRSHPSKFKIDDLGFRIARNKPVNSNGA